ncbi:Hypothetical protein PBC10988_12450 [Planctomycetales bacterium 10988]|nr:Hypothetical protein PBC10988_12450 [Planctomycetales bacterium 10988]
MPARFRVIRPAEAQQEATASEDLASLEESLTEELESPELQALGKELMLQAEEQWQLTKDLPLPAGLDLAQPAEADAIRPAETPQQPNRSKASTLQGKTLWLSAMLVGIIGVGAGGWFSISPAAKNPSHTQQDQENSLSINQESPTQPSSEDLPPVETLAVHQPNPEQQSTKAITVSHTKKMAYDTKLVEMYLQLDGPLREAMVDLEAKGELDRPRLSF